MVKRGFDGKGHDLASLKLKTTARCENPKMLADAMKSYPGAEDVNTRDCTLEGLELFGSTKRKLNLPPGVDCESHRFEKVNYSIPHPNTRAIRQRIEESLSSAIHGVAHTTSMLETNCFASKWHIARLPSNSAKRCWALQTIIGTVRCQNRDWETWHTCSNIQKAQKGISFHPTLWSMNFGFVLMTSRVV
jgi:hypothetical protein